MPQWAKDLKAQVDKLSSKPGGPEGPQKIPPTTPPKPDDKKPDNQEAPKPEAKKSKSFLDWILG